MYSPARCSPAETRSTCAGNIKRIRVLCMAALWLNHLKAVSLKESVSPYTQTEHRAAQYNRLDKRSAHDIFDDKRQAGLCKGLSCRLD